MPSSFLECHCECQSNEWKDKFRVGAQRIMSGFDCFECALNGLLSTIQSNSTRKWSPFFCHKCMCTYGLFQFANPCQFLFHLWKHFVFEIIGVACFWSSYLHMSAWRYRVACCFCFEFCCDYFLH
jgi:hypothetical protein